MGQKLATTSGAKKIVSNCNNYIIQRQNHHADAEQLANIIGTLDDFEVTSQVSSKSGSTGVGTVRQSRQFIVHPDEIKRLPKGQGIFVNKQNFSVSRCLFLRSRLVDL